MDEKIFLMDCKVIQLPIIKILLNDKKIDFSCKEIIGSGDIKISVFEKDLDLAKKIIEDHFKKITIDESIVEDKSDINKSQKRIKSLAIYQIVFGTLGVLLSIFSSFQDITRMFVILFFLLPLAAGIFLFIKKLHRVGILISIINNLLQSVIFIVGPVWYEFQAGLSLGIQFRQMNRNMWNGTSTGLLFNIGTRHNFLFSNQNTNFYFGINFFAIMIVVFLIRNSIIGNNDINGSEEEITADNPDIIIPYEEK